MFQTGTQPVIADVGYAGKAEWADVKERVLLRRARFAAKRCLRNVCAWGVSRRCNQIFSEHAMTIKVLRHNT